MKITSELSEQKPRSVVLNGIPPLPGSISLLYNRKYVVRGGQRMHELRPVTGRSFFDTIQESIETAIL